MEKRSCKARKQNIKKKKEELELALRGYISPQTALQEADHSVRGSKN